jgi:hypothetical protein
MRISDTPKISSSPDIACSLTKRSSKSLQKTSILLRLLNWKSANRSRLQSVPDSTFQPAGFSSECRLSATLALKRFGLGRNRKWNWAHVSSQRHQVFMFFTFTAPASDGIKPRSIPWTDGCPLPNLRLISHWRCPLNTFIKIDSLTLPSSSLVIHLPTLRGCSQSPDRDMVAKPHRPDEGREANHRPNISLKK